MSRLSSYHQVTDAQIWDDFLQGSKAAYAFMYEKYARLLYNYGYKIAQDRQLTEDCLHDLFLAILETRERLGHTDSIKFYLMRSLRREIIRRIQLQQRFLERPDQDVGFDVAFRYEPTWLDVQINREQSNAILRELNQLPTRQKEALFLKFFDNLSYDEIAGIMGIGTTSVYKVIYKAIAALQKRVPADWLVLLILFFGL